MEKDAEILSVGKIAESARFAEEEDLSLKTDFVSSSEASYGWLPSVAFVERHRGQVPLNFDKGRNQREEVCDEGVGLWGESQVSNDFPKIVDKIPDDRGWNRGKPGVNSVTLQRGGSESLRICLQSSYSRLCGGNRWLPLTAFVERRQGQVPL